MGTQANIARTIRDRQADYLLAVKDNHPTLAESMREFFATFKAAPDKTAHSFFETTEKGYGRIEQRRGFAFAQLDCLYKPAQWPDLRSFVVIESERTVKGKTTVEQRYYFSSLPPDAFADDQMRARSGHAAHNLALLKHITMNLIRLDPIPRKDGIKVRRLVAATSDDYRAHLLRLG